MSSTLRATTVSVALTPDMTEPVQQAVAGGEFASGSEVISEALREWKHRRTPSRVQQDELRHACAEAWPAVRAGAPPSTTSNARATAAQKRRPTEVTRADDARPGWSRTARAEEDLIEIRQRIAYDNHAAADALLHRIDRVCERLQCLEFGPGIWRT